ncbi:MAG: indole-3-glycerol-phosphate synthase TrpC, partial [Planctomycetes bacterium]|nr:indole-3-glycerol-phosphate synthase TrpC [Planctomycetota bacterium]
ADQLGIEILLEVHDLDELRRLAAFSPRIIGINNRDLKTFEVSLETTRSLLPEVPEGAVVISESGFFKREELEMMTGWGVDGFLIGEGLMRAENPGEALAGLLGAAGEESVT